MVNALAAIKDGNHRTPSFLSNANIDMGHMRICNITHAAMTP